MNKPVTISKEEFIENLTMLINESKLAPIILEPILKEFHSNIKTMYLRQLQEDKERYYSNMNEEKG